ncbi:MAG: S8/S53 family peptidase [Elusimicrobiota bacterium]|nr:S8/S53 family peptidase [Elusimicrobiota bacterium]
MKDWKVYFKVGLIMVFCGFAAILIFNSFLFYNTEYSSSGNSFGVLERKASHKTTRKNLNPFENKNDKSTNRDLSGIDLSAVDLSDKAAILLNSDFDTSTVWPKKLPKSFNPSKTFEMGKNPGFGIRTLHKKNINGKGVSIAVIDQRIFTGHSDYKERLKLYEEIHYSSLHNLLERGGHGEAMVSISAGKVSGVAPKSDIYYIATDPGTMSIFSSSWYVYDFKWLAKSVRRVLAINKILPEAKKIKVLVFSFAWPDGSVKGYDDLLEVLSEAAKEGIFISSPLSLKLYGYRIAALDRESMRDPELFASYKPSIWFESFLSGAEAIKTIYAPSNSRTVASSNNKDNYQFFMQGRYSFALSYVAGVYALAYQADKSMIPGKFLKAAFDTSENLTIQKKDKKYKIKVISPKKIINKLSKEIKI